MLMEEDGALAPGPTRAMGRDGEKRSARAQEKVEGVGATSASERDTSEKERDEKIATRVGGFGGVG